MESLVKWVVLNSRVCCNVHRSSHFSLLLGYCVQLWCFNAKNSVEVDGKWSLEDEPCVVMLQEMELLKGELIGDLITGCRGLAGQQHAFKSWNWKLEWFSNQTMNPGFAGHSAVEVLTREKGRHWQNRGFKRWERSVGKHVVSMRTCSTRAGALAQVPAISTFQNTLQSRVNLGVGVWGSGTRFIFAVFFLSSLRV